MSPAGTVGVLYLLDTNIVSYYLRRSSAGLEARLSEALLQQSVAISVLTRAELRFGQSGMAGDDRRRQLIDHFLEQLPCLPWTQEAADVYGTLKDRHRRLGTPIGEIDTQIAAQALAEGLILVTHNTRHFDKVSGLTLEDWMTEPPVPAKSKRLRSSSELPGMVKATSRGKSRRLEDFDPAAPPARSRRIQP